MQLPTPALRVLRRVFGVLTPRQRLATVGIFLLGLVSSVMEIFGLALVVPTVLILLGDELPGWVSRLPLLGSVDSTRIGSLLVGLVVGVFVVRNVLSWIVMLVQAKYVAFTAGSLRALVFRARTNDEYERFVSGTNAERVRNIENSVALVSHLLVPMSNLAVDAILFGGSTLVLFYVNPWGTLGSVFVLASLVFVGIRVTGRHLERWGEERRRADQEVLQTMYETFSSFKEILLAGAKGYFLERHRSALQTMQHRVFRFSVLSGTNRYVLEVLGLLIFGVFMTAGVLSGSGTTESLAGAALVGGTLVRTLPAINRFLSNLQTIKFGVTTVESVLSEVELARQTLISESDEIRQSLHFQSLVADNLTYVFPDSNEPLLRGICFAIKRGDRLAIVGPSGTGKSTLVELLLGLRRCSTGRVLLNSKEIDRVPAHLWNLVGYVPQHVSLINGSVAENIAFGIETRDADRQLLTRVMQLMELPADLTLEERSVGDAGTSVSGGQRQRIGIARALYRRPQLLILDEATTNVDSDTRKRILDAIDELGSDITIVHVTHDPSVISRCLQRFDLSNQ